MAHTCHAEGCPTAVPPRMHMCKSHWFMVPKGLRDALWAAYVPGQERRKDPTGDYLVAAERCICAVAVKEGRMTQDQADEQIAGTIEDAEYMADIFKTVYGDGA